MDFEDLTILSWNIRGALSLEGRRHAKELVRKHNPLYFYNGNSLSFFESITILESKV